MSATPPPPDPGTGTVWVNQIDGELWSASWQQGGSCLDFDGTYSAVVEWANQQPAEARLIFDHRLDEYRPL